MRFVLKTAATVATVALAFGLSQPAFAATRQMEKLSRGLAVSAVAGGTLVSWRLLGTEKPETEFVLYRDGKKVASIGGAEGTNYLDADGTVASKYTVAPVVNGNEGTASGVSVVFDKNHKDSNSKITFPYRTYMLDAPAGGTTPSGETYVYSANDMSVGDLDGDGNYELIVKWDPSNSKDNSAAKEGNYTGNVIVDAYKISADSEKAVRLWRIDLGRNIRAGAHYTQFMVYDLDGDGIAEIAMKTSDGTVDGTGKVIGDASKDYRTTAGTIMSGNEFLTVFNGKTGAAVSTVDYWPSRGHISGDSYGNRDNRMNAGIAYLDGVHPSLVMARGYYTEAYVAAYDFDGRSLKVRWQHSSDKSGQGLYGEGNHNWSIGDIDGDGKDEIVFGSAALNADGTVKYRTGFGHGDAMHLSDMDPDRPGLEVWDVHEDGLAATYTEEFRDKDGKVIWGTLQATYGDGTGVDNGRGLAADLDSNNRGFEMWSGTSGGVRTVSGAMWAEGVIPSQNFRIYFDGDLQDELLDAVGSPKAGTYGYNVGGKIEKWNSTTKGIDRYFSFYNVESSSLNNYTKANPCLVADIFGDWREELITRAGDDQNKIIVFSTPVTSPYRVYALMHDAQYRVSIAWQNNGYNQPAHLSYYLPDMVKNLRQPMIYLASESESSAASDTLKLVNDGKSALDASTPKDGDGWSETTNAGFMEKGYFNFDNTLSSYGIWEVFSQKGAKTTLTIRYANGGTADRNMELVVNGVSTGTLSFATTGAWTTYGETAVDVVLDQGVNTLALASLTGDGGPNVDMFTFGIDGVELYDGSQELREEDVPMPLSAVAAQGVSFNPQTGVLFTPKAGFAEVYLYDMAGNMRMAVSKNVVAGANAVSLDRELLPKGTYIVKVKLDGKLMQKGMVVRN